MLDSFFVYGKLKSLPVQYKKKRIVLEELVKMFLPARRYTEKEVNILIADVNEDFCTLRRELICEHLLDRDHGVYWRVEAEKDIESKDGEKGEG